MQHEALQHIIVNLPQCTAIFDTARRNRLCFRWMSRSIHITLDILKLYHYRQWYMTAFRERTLCPWCQPKSIAGVLGMLCGLPVDCFFYHFSRFISLSDDQVAYSYFRIRWHLTTSTLFTIYLSISVWCRRENVAWFFILGPFLGQVLNVLRHCCDLQCFCWD